MKKTLKRNRLVGQSPSLISAHEKFSPCRPSAGALIEGSRRHSSHLIAILAMEISENSLEPICLQNYWGRGQIWCVFSPTAGISFLKTKMLFRKSMNQHWMTFVEDLFKGAGEWKVDWVLLRMLFRQLKKKLFGKTAACSTELVLNGYPKPTRCLLFLSTPYLIPFWKSPGSG